MMFKDPGDPHVTDLEFSVSLMLHLVDKGVLNQSDIDAINDMAEQAARERVAGWEDFKVLRGLDPNFRTPWDEEDGTDESV